MATVLVLVLFASLLSAGSPAAAAEDVDMDRQEAVWDLSAGGPSVRRAAEAALTGSDADLQTYLDSGYDAAMEADERSAAQVLAAMDGPTVRGAAEQALAGSRAQVQAFIDDGWHKPFEADERIRAYRLIEGGGPTMKAAAQRALEGSADDMTEFMSSGRDAAQYADERLEATRMLTGAVNNSGPVLDAAAKEALAGTADQLHDFLARGQFTARARDKETAQLTALTTQARDAGLDTAREALAAQEASERAEQAAAQAKGAAQTAAAEAKAAGKDAAKASAAAGRAADAAQGAANAAREAISASNAAMRAARVAADASRRAQSAASLTAQAAARAQRAASAAHLNAGDARLAREAAEAARDAAAKARELAQVKAESDRAQAQAKAASQAAKRASGNAAAAGLAADEAGRQSGVSAAQAARARNAAGEAAAAAATADRAADRAEALAASAAKASQEAFAFAARAAEHADNAAAAAIRAAEAAEAGRKSAVEAYERAQAAVESANLAVQAAGDAATVEKLAREEDEARRAEWTQQGVLAAQEALTVERAVTASGGEAAAWNRTLAWDTAEQDRIDAGTRQLLDQASVSGASTAVVLDNGRRAALALTTTGGDWTKKAAEAVLTGGETELRSWLTEGRRFAAGQDDRARAWRLVDTLPDGAEKTAVQTALNGDDATVEAFLRTRAYPGKVGLDRQKLYAIIAAATDMPNLKAAAQKALAGTATEAHVFLRDGQHAARAADERLLAYRAMDCECPEVKAAGQVALAGPASYVSYFLAVGRYDAAQLDAEQTAHVNSMRALVGQAQQYANTALYDANKAGEAAQRARNLSADADKFAAAARAASTKAEEHRQNAATAATAAQKSAEQAAASATTARNAANSAQASASRAAQSAATATAASHRAQQSATAAYRAAESARADAQAAGKDAAAADVAAKQAAAIYSAKVKEWEAQQRSTAPGSGADGQGTAADDQKTWGCLVLDPSAVSSECIKVYKDFAGALIDPAKCSNPANNGTSGCAMLGDIKELVGENQELLLDVLQFTLMACGLIPGAGEVCDGIDAAVSFGRGDYVGGILSGFSAIPVLGYAATGIKAFKNSDKLRSIKELFEKLFKRCKGSSFVPGTLVVLASGRRVAIEQVQKDDEVQATEPTVGGVAAKAVAGTTTSVGVKRIIDIGIDDDNNPSTEPVVVSATQSHPFWVPPLNAWVPASALAAGMPLLGLDGNRVQVATVTERTVTTQVHNLSIAEVPTYYVAAGNAAVLVHNCPVKIPEDPPKPPVYENNGHHDPYGGTEPYNPRKCVLPADAEEQFANSIDIEGVRWAKIGKGKKAVYYRYFNDQNGNWHFSGASNGVRKNGQPDPIEEQDIPIQIKRKK
ncbi:ALF repeat-containing protein [Actinoplanes sp. Pm04-4]|uniref:ALF repeat-containing protein n=1 Tax=Paractinoplanes pyxinae TaxID=2997416 RepID=A0ABT4BCL4_9ACTN|nr:ALF repeat-containing protein [Actinoplanes pyxinae]MCY1144260.1 ALF repeat-containing protein [Actinoplanes pyxinae]